MNIQSEYRTLGDTDIKVSPVALGCWPISGMTSLGVNDVDSLATLRAAVDEGVNFFDTAYMYGADGESEKLIARALGRHRDEIVIATKCGLHWSSQGKRVAGGHPETLRRECDTSLRRLQTDRVELLYLHAPDPCVPLADSAGAMRELREAGKTLCVGVSNVTLSQLEQFHAICPIAAFQPPYNLLQRQIELDTLPWCREHNVAVVVYWPLLKGLLAGKLSRDHVFQPGDGRPKYAMFQGKEWQKNHDFVDRLREIAEDEGKSVSQIAVNWAIHQPGITSALCGAKRAYQIEEAAGAMGWRLSDQALRRIDAALEQRGEAVVESPV
jgi:aryl-alcohol dehydrogenase-like predicted oxidoreductase